MVVIYTFTLFLKKTKRKKRRVKKSHFWALGWIWVRPAALRPATSEMISKVLVGAEIWNLTRGLWAPNELTYFLSTQPQALHLPYKQ